MQDFLVPAGSATSFTFDKSKFVAIASHAACLAVTISGVECRNKANDLLGNYITATMESSGGSFTVTPSSDHNFVAEPQLCKVIFNVAYNLDFGTATLINPNTGTSVGNGTSITYTSRDFGFFKMKKRDTAPTSYDETIRIIDLTTVFMTSADTIDSSFGNEWQELYTASFKATGLTYSATYTVGALTQDPRTYLPGYDVTGKTFELVVS